MSGMDDMTSALKGLGLTRDNGQNSRALLAAASAGKVTALACAMPECVCPEGRGHFEPIGHGSPWAPSADRWPIAGRDGGAYRADNVRLAHRRCNTLAGTRITHQRLRESGYYGSPKHREVGRRLGIGRREGMLEWWKTPEGEAARELGQRRMREHWAAATPEQRAEAGRRVNSARDPEASRRAARENLERARPALAESRKDPDVRSALVEHGRRLGAEHGSSALARFRSSPEGHAQAVENGRRLSCQRWNLNRGKPCVCGHHAGIA